MPIYEYECRRCGTEVTRLVLAPSDAMTACDRCGGELRRLLSACNVRGTRSGDPRALQSPRSWFDKPERFGDAMRALGEKSNVKFDAGSLDAAVDRLKASRDG